VLSRSAEYAVRALSLLAVRGEEESLHSREIAEQLGLPPQFLTKILRRLTTTDLVSSRRGRAGGFRLNRDPGSIALLDVVMPFEAQWTGVECILGQAYCSDQEACPLHQQWVAIRRSFYDLLERTTLAEVAQRAIRLSEITGTATGDESSMTPHPHRDRSIGGP
jgi:Rrf2 family protein